MSWSPHRLVPESRFMEVAIETASAQLGAVDGGPFGACIVRAGQVLAACHNTVLRERDPTCHAEVNAVRAAARVLSSYDLSGCAIYSTTEPCPMCFSAIHWARIDGVVYGTTIGDVRVLGFHELVIGNEQMRALGGSSVAVHGPFMRRECLALLERWSRMPGRQVY